MQSFFEIKAKRGDEKFLSMKDFNDHIKKQKKMINEH